MERRAPRVVYVGMFGVLSRAPLAALLAAGIDVRAIVVPAPAETRAAPLRRLEPPGGSGSRPGRLPTLKDFLRQTIVDVGWLHGIPVLEVARPGHRAVRDALAALAPDLIAVSCFPHKLPPALLTLPPLGCLNLHPALLPANRGPAPLFWTFREGLPGGATVHLMDEGLDSGPIVAQEGFALSDGLTGAELELQCAALGAELMAGAVRDLAAGVATPVPQDESRASVYPWPSAADFLVTPDRPARWAFNFIRGTAGWGHPHRLALPGAGGECVTIRAARAFDPDANLGAPFRRDGDELRVQCSPGVLTVTVAG